MRLIKVHVLESLAGCLILVVIIQLGQPQSLNLMHYLGLKWPKNPLVLCCVANEAVLPSSAVGKLVTPVSAHTCMHMTCMCIHGDLGEW